MSAQVFKNESAVLPLLANSEKSLLIWSSLPAALRLRRLMLTARRGGWLGGWVLAGPPAHAAVFEMDALDLQWLENPEELTSQADGWLAKRAQLKQFDSLPERSGCGACVLAGDPEGHIPHLLQSAFGSQFYRLEELGEGEVPPGEQLQAGPAALARITQRLRSQPANALRVLVVSKHCDQPLASLERLCVALEICAAEARRLGLQLAPSFGLYGAVNRLVLRKTREALPSLQVLSVPELIGEAAYADSVLTDSSEVKLLALEMGRTNTRVL